MSPDRAAREARLMAETLASQAHDEAQARIRAAVRPRGDRGSGAILLLAAAVPLLVLIVLAVANLAGAVAGIADAGGVR